MHNLYPFAQNVFAHHFSWVGGLLTVLGVGELVLGKKILLSAKWVLRIGVVFLFIACCQAWFDEHRNVQNLIAEKASLGGQVYQLQQQLVFKQTPIEVQFPQSLTQKSTKAVATSKPSIQQKSEGPNSPNIAGSGNQVTINPELNPNAPTTYYDFNGVKHVQQGSRSQTTLGAESEVFQQIQQLYGSKDWQGLNDLCEEQMAKYPDWLTPYLFSGVALANLGQRDKAIERLEHVSEKSAGRDDYKDADRIVGVLRQRQ